jgi:Domain of unknown function (DUF4279)
LILSDDRKWFRVTLRLMGDNLPVERIGTKLGVEPSFIGIKGEHIRNNPAYAKFPTNIWGWEYLSDSAVPFEDQISGLLKAIEPRKESLDEILSIAGTDAELYLGFSSGNGQGGAHLPAEMLGRISSLGLAIELDLYPPDVEEGRTK